MRTDLELDEYGSIVVADGDFRFVESDSQHVQDTINAGPGWWKENPNDGVNIFAYVNSDGMEQEIARNCQIQLNADGYNIAYPKITKNPDGTFNIPIQLPN